ncbi:heme exporter protein CcmD [Kordiimonas aquimaris]|uniref:heme exporter protein CcmD n=1 Tax=Kordiimonas aquimaris TaxID=707591 RepID=UPI0021D223FA|nr:heme exporter protein CcmD [Kordiimonas aquimaris]
MTEFLNMGGYGAFVWTAYGLSAISLVTLVLRSRARANAVLLQVDAMRRRRKEEG